MGFLSNIFGQKQHTKSNPDLAFYEEVVDHITISETLKNDLKVKLKQAFEFLPICPDATEAIHNVLAGILQCKKGG